MTLYLTLQNMLSHIYSSLSSVFTQSAEYKWIWGFSQYENNPQIQNIISFAIMLRLLTLEHSEVE